MVWPSTRIGNSHGCSGGNKAISERARAADQHAAGEAEQDLEQRHLGVVEQQRRGAHEPAGNRGRRRQQKGAARP